MIKAAIYCRVSTEDQLKGASIDAQKYELKDLAELYGLEISREYTDQGRTGSDMDRAYLLNMITDAGAGLFKVLLVYHNDRLSRNVEDVRRIIRELDAAGVQVRFKNISQDLKTPEGKFTLNVLAAASEFYIDDLKRKTKSGMAERKRAGTWTGRLPGAFYLEDPAQGNKWHNIKPQADIIPMLLEIDILRAAGKSWRFIGNAWDLDHKKVKRYWVLMSWLRGQYAGRNLDLWERAI